MPLSSSSRTATGSIVSSFRTASGSVAPSSDFRTILARVKDLENLVKENKKDVEAVSETSHIIEGNLSSFADEVMERLSNMENRFVKVVEEKLASIEERLSALERPSSAESATLLSGTKRKLSRNPGLSVRILFSLHLIA